MPPRGRRPRRSIPYIERELARGTRLHAITRHVLGLFRGVPGARAFRRHLATEGVKPGADAHTFRAALALVVDFDARMAHTAAALIFRRTASRRPSCAVVPPEQDMILGVPVSELLLLAALIIVGGFVTGILAGLFGIGGGALIVPVLYEVFRALDVPDEVRFQLCVGTSIAIIVPTNVLSFLTHRDKGAVMMDVVRAWTPPAVVGVAVGSAIAAFAPAAVLKLAFVLVGSVISIKLLVGRDSWRLADDLPGSGGMTAYGFFVGLAASLMGISGGSISNMILTLHGKSMHSAVATSAGLGVPITIAGTIGYILAGLPQQSLMPPLSLGFVSLIGFALMAPVSSFTASYGARLAHALSKRRLEVAFGCFLLIVCARFAASLFG